MRLWMLVTLAAIAQAQVSIAPELSVETPVPANLLRFYVRFPKAMARGRVLGSLHLLREDGREVPMPFLDQELWDREQRRLTVLIDPGRVKRGVAPQVEMGEVLEAGRRYTFVVDGTAQQADGASMGTAFRREFRAGLAVRQGIDPNQWRVTASGASVTVDFDRVMDAAILEWALDVYDGSGKPVDGDVRVESGETRWVFTPARPLAAGRYELRIDPALEDIAGNRLGRPFDVDVALRPAAAVTTALTFEIR